MNDIQRTLHQLSMRMNTEKFVLKIKVDNIETEETIKSIDEGSFTITFASENTLQYENGTFTYTKSKIEYNINMGDIQGLTSGSNIKGSIGWRGLSFAWGGRTSKRRSRRPKRSRRYKSNKYIHVDHSRYFMRHRKHGIH